MFGRILTKKKKIGEITLGDVRVREIIGEVLNAKPDEAKRGEGPDGRRQIQT